MITGFTNPHNMYRLDRPMRVEKVENGVILPQLLIEEKKPKWGLGGVCDKEGKFVDLSYYDGNWATHGGGYDFDEEEYRDETAVYFGVFFKHWGHFLIDLIGRAWYFVGKDMSKVKVAYLGEVEPMGNYLQFFELLGVPKENLIRIDKPTRFREVIVPEYSASSCVWYTDEYSSIFEEIARKVMAENIEVTVPEKVYFSRLAFGKAKRTEVGEEYLAAWLSANGYQSVAPETLSLKEQVYIWNKAKYIACLDGTIPINLNFSENKDLNLLVMHKTHLEHLNLEMSLLMRSCHVTLLDAYWEPFKKYPKSIGRGPFLLCISDDVIEFSRNSDMAMPFDEKTIKKQRKKSYWKLVKVIMDVKGRVRRIISKIVPASIKKKLRGR